jgi:hypothetical protein
LLLHGLLAVGVAFPHNVTMDETGHLLSGLLAWKRGDVTCYYVNPPLLKMIQAIPLLPLDWELPRQRQSPLPTFADWIADKDEFLAANVDRFFLYLPWARCMNVVLSLAGGWLVYRWSRALFGTAAGLVALTLWCLCPNILAWTGVCTADLGAAVFALAAMYGLRTYIRQPAAATAFGAGLLLGLAQLVKFSLLILYPIVIFLWVIAWSSARPTDESGKRPRWVHLVILLLISLLVINLGYGFQGTGWPLGSFLFKCHALSGSQEGGWRNRFHETWLKDIPMPLPAAYIMGLDEQKSHVDEGRWGYLRGEWRVGGWWYYYLYALAVKVPLGTWFLMVMAVVLACWSRRLRTDRLEEMLVWVPLVAVLSFMSWQAGINKHLRYLSPVFPFLFIGISRVGKWFAGAPSESAGKDAAGPRAGIGWGLGRLLATASILGALTWNSVSVLRVHPHHLSYFNELAGGPDYGWLHLIDSNLDWGQDLLFLKRWMEDHPEARPLGLAYYGAIDPHMVGLTYRLAPRGLNEPLAQSMGEIYAKELILQQQFEFDVLVPFQPGLTV